MMPTLEALQPIFTLVVLGARLRRSGFPSNDFWYPLERLIYFLLFSALLVDRLARAIRQAGPRSDRRSDCGRCTAAVANLAPARPRTRF
jgi:predicted permease|tara:strand:- start:647 stop:913 length:267 start_codon:yes stop_codon:yes gene_type:complete